MTTRDRHKRKLLLLDMDSASLPFIQANLDHLPTFRALMAARPPTRLESPSHTVSASVWPGFATGAEPGVHGHYFPMQWDPRRMRFYRIKRGDLDYRTFWDNLADAGLDIIVLDANQLNIDRDSPGLQIVNWNAQSSGALMSNNPAIASEFVRRFGRRPIGAEITLEKPAGRLLAMRDRLVACAERTTDAVLWLARRHPWDLLIASFHELHRGGHSLWPEVNSDFVASPPPKALLDVYRKFDAQLARLLAAFEGEPVSIVLFALNDIGPNTAQNHFLPEMLNRINAAFWEQEGAGEGKPTRRGLARYLRESLPSSLQLAIRDRVGQGVQDWVVNRQYTGGIDWQRTPAFVAPSGGEGYIRLNLKGREAQGCLPASGGMKDRYLSFLQEQLMAFRVTATQEPLISQVIDLHARFPGARSDELPDLQCLWHPAAPMSQVESPLLGEIEARLSTGRPGNHTAAGDAFALFAGRELPSSLADSLQKIQDFGKFSRDYFAS